MRIRLGSACRPRVGTARPPPRRHPRANYGQRASIAVKGHSGHSSIYVRLYNVIYFGFHGLVVLDLTYLG
jgi:hypothetical protein